MDKIEPFEARYSPIRSLLLGVLSLGFVAIGLWMIGAFADVPSGTRRVPDWMIPIVGWLAIVLFGPLALRHLVRVFVPDTSVRIDQDGMFIQGYGSEPIPWKDFLYFAPLNMMGTHSLNFDLTPSRWQRVALLKRIVLKSNEFFGVKGGSLLINNTDRKHQDMVEAVVHFAPLRLTEWLR